MGHPDTTDTILVTFSKPISLLIQNKLVRSVTCEVIEVYLKSTKIVYRSTIEKCRHTLKKC